MNKLVKYILIIISLFYYYGTAVADTIEIEHYNAIYKKTYISSIHDYKGPGGTTLNKDALDYSVSILKNVPWSKESYCTLALLSSADALTDDVKEETLQMIDKYIYQQMSLDENISEKLITIALLFQCISKEDLKNVKEKREIAQDFLIKLCDYSDKNYASLANELIFIREKSIYKDTKREKYINLFKEKYPEHPALPILELDYIYKPYHMAMPIFNTLALMDKSSAEEKIIKIKALSEKYKNYIMPTGDTYQAQCWACIAMCYDDLGQGNNEKAKEYIKLIESKEPNCTLLPFLKFMVE